MLNYEARSRSTKKEEKSGCNYIIGPNGASIVQDVGGIMDTLMFQADPQKKKHLKQDSIAAKYSDSNGTVFKYPFPAGSIIKFNDKYTVPKKINENGVLKDSTTIGTAFAIPDTTHSWNLARIAGQALDVEAGIINLAQNK